LNLIWIRPVFTKTTKPTDFIDICKTRQLSSISEIPACKDHLCIHEASDLRGPCVFMKQVTFQPRVFMKQVTCQPRVFMKQKWLPCCSGSCRARGRSTRRDCVLAAGESWSQYSLHATFQWSQGRDHGRYWDTNLQFGKILWSTPTKGGFAYNTSTITFLSESHKDSGGGAGAGATYTMPT
jgi:hypothetical protein